MDTNLRWHTTTCPLGFSVMGVWGPKFIGNEQGARDGNPTGTSVKAVDLSNDETLVLLVRIHSEGSCLVNRSAFVLS